MPDGNPTSDPAATSPPLSNPVSRAGPRPPLAAPQRPRPRWAQTFRSLRHRDYRLYFLGQLVSLTGSWVQTTALAWLAYELTGQSLWPAWISAASVLPTFVLGALGGALVDRWPKRPLLLVTQALFLLLAALLAWLVAAGDITPWQMLFLTLAGGIVTAIDLPARLAFVVEMVGRDDLLNAVALNSLMFNLARALGPFLAGLLLTAVGPAHCFLFNALSYVAVLAALWLIRAGNTVPGRDRTRGHGSLWSGFRYLAARPILLLLLLLAALMSFFGWPAMSLLPALAQHALGMSEDGYSLMLSGIGTGALVGALAVATFGSVARRRAFIGWGVFLLAAGLLVLSLVHNLWLATGCCALAGFGLILFFATSQTVFQLGSDDHNRGRIMGIWSMILSGAQPLGNLLAGPAADRFGEPLVLRLEGLGCFASALGVMALLRTLDRRTGHAP